jgi:LCP family protein required for cell wall assembly
MSVEEPMDTATSQHTVRKRPWLAAVASALVPGAGQLYAGATVRAIVWFSPTILLVAATVRLASMGTLDLIGAALDPPVLWAIFTANVVVALWRIGAAVDAYALVAGRVRPDAAIGVAVGWAILGIALLVPHLAIGRYTYDAVTLVEAVFIVGEPDATAEPIIPIGTDADIVPDPVVVTYEVDTPTPRSNRNLIFRDGVGDPDAVASWDAVVAAGHDSNSSDAPFVDFGERVGTERISILFAGGDAGPGRGGLRTDSMMVGTIDLVTGRAALFSFPRNMAQIPLPKRFADAFIDLERRMTPPPVVEDGQEPPPFVSCRCFPEQMNAIYPFTRKWTGTYRDEVDPGMAALRDVIENLMGMNIDYYALIDMAAFVDLVDAIGGIDVYVLEPLESEVSPPREGEPWAYVNVEPGWNHLDGPQALAYARARKGSSDYARMERQRCMVKAVAAKADAFTLLRSFSAIVRAIDGSVVTDMPLTFVPELIEAVSTLDFSDIETVGITHPYWLDQRDYNGKPVPDVGRIRAKVDRVLAGQSSPDAEFTVSSECEV